MPFKLNQDCRHHIPKQKHKVTNSAAYDAALVLVLAESFLSCAFGCLRGLGTSTRSADNLVPSTGMDGISKSQVSRLCGEIDERVNAFLARPIEGDWPYLWLDVKARRHHHIVSVAVIVAVGVNADGRREVLGMTTGHREAEPFWVEFLRGLARRGLRGTKLVVFHARADRIRNGPPAAKPRRRHQGPGGPGNRSANRPGPDLQDPSLSGRRETEQFTLAASFGCETTIRKGVRRLHTAGKRFQL